MQIIKKDSWSRHDVLNLLQSDGNTGIELGVAQGGYSKRMVDSKKFIKFFGVDMYADMHDTNEYKTALKTVGLEKNYSLLRMRFDEALDLFEDESLDFVYIDGYAHSGQLGGETIFDWYPKVKEGGVISGDDYDEDKWPLVVKSVNELASQLDADLYLTGTENSDYFSEYSSWAIIKKDLRPVKSSKMQVTQGKLIDRQVAVKRKIINKIKSSLPNSVIKVVKKLFR